MAIALSIYEINFKRIFKGGLEYVNMESVKRNGNTAIATR